METLEGEEQTALMEEEKKKRERWRKRGKKRVS